MFCYYSAEELSYTKVLGQLQDATCLGPANTWIKRLGSSMRVLRVDN